MDHQDYRVMWAWQQAQQDAERAEVERMRAAIGRA